MARNLHCAAALKRLFMEKVLVQRDDGGFVSVIAQVNRDLCSLIPDPDDLDVCADGSRLNRLCQAVMDLYGYLKVIDLLRRDVLKPKKYTVEPEKVALQFAVALKDEAAVRAIVGKVSDLCCRRGYLLTTAVHMAAQKGSGEILSLLLDQPCFDVRTVKRWKRTKLLRLEDQRQLTPLFAALQSANEQTLRVLLAREEVDPNRTDKGTTAPLHLAAHFGWEHIARALLERPDINANVTDLTGSTPLVLAATRGHLHIVRLLLARKDVDPEAMTHDSNTPFSTACAMGQENVVKFLLERDDIDFNRINSRGETPVELAALKGRLSVVQLLLDSERVSGPNCGLQAPTDFLAMVAATTSRLMLRLILTYAVTRGGETLDALLAKAAELGEELIAYEILTFQGIDCLDLDGEGHQILETTRGNRPNYRLYGPGPDADPQALQCYQMQLMLLEQANKRRLLMARREMEDATDGVFYPSVVSG